MKYYLILFSLLIAGCATRAVVTHQVDLDSIYSRVGSANDYVERGRKEAVAIDTQPKIITKQLSSDLVQNLTQAKALLDRVVAEKAGIEKQANDQAKELSIALTQVRDLTAQIVTKDRTILNRDRTIFYQWIAIGSMAIGFGVCVWLRIKGIL